MALRTMHVGVGVGFLEELIKERGNKGFVETDGLPLPDAEALAWLEEKRAKGVTIFNSCPTPERDGGCPGHKKEASA